MSSSAKSRLPSAAGFRFGSGRAGLYPGQRCLKLLEERRRVRHDFDVVSATFVKDGRVSRVVRLCRLNNGSVTPKMTTNTAAL